ncbi:MAG: hypothetical protein CMJ88_08775 [Planctomycetes bacterium]|nr:hypothetical protein [Planctomycetota bacterium]
MSYDPRTIAFAAEILYPPQQLRADLIQNVHNTLYSQPKLGYQNFQVAQDGIHLTNLPQAPGQVSMASFRFDRLILREEMRGATVEDFATRAVNVATTALRALSIPNTIAQQFVIRSLIAPRNFQDGREFLSRRLMPKIADEGSAFGRPMASLGVRYVFPPHQDAAETFQVRVETWPQDQRSIWIENTSSYTLQLSTDDLPRIADQLAATYQHITGPVCSFLAKLDTP